MNLGIRVALPGMWGGQFGIASGSPHLVGRRAPTLDEPFVELRGLHFHRGLTIRHRDDDGRLRARCRRACCDDLRAATGLASRRSSTSAAAWPAPTVGADPIAASSASTGRSAPTCSRRIRRTACRSADAVDRWRRPRSESHFDAGGLSAPAVILEPGRALTGDTQFLLTTVVDVKDDGGLSHAVLDAGDQRRRAGSQRVPPGVQRLGARPSRTTPRTGWSGPICTPADVLYNNWRLPPLGARPRSRGDGLRCLLRSVLDELLVPPAGDRDAGRTLRHDLAPARDVRGHRRPGPSQRGGGPRRARRCPP